MKFTHNKKIEIPSDAEKMLRRIISIWASKIPHHDYANLGGQINIRDIVFCPSYEIGILTQFYSVNEYYSKRAYKGETLNANKPQIIDSQIPFGKFVNKETSYMVPGTEVLYSCSKCKGIGTNQCKTCNGHGELICNPCKGKIKCSHCDQNGDMPCSSCNGSGRIKCTYCNGDCYVWSYESRTEWDYRSQKNITIAGNVKKPCKNCDRTGKVRCRSVFCYYGKTRCGYCSGRAYNPCGYCSSKGKLQCGECHGDGRVKCTSCQGSGKEVHFKGRTRRWYNQNISQIAVNPICNRSKYPNFNLLPKFYRKIIYSELFRRSDIDLFNSEPSHFRQAFENVITKSFKPIKNASDSYTQLLHQKIICSMISMYRIEYTFEEKEYTMLVLDEDESVYEEFGPIENKRLDFKKEGLQLLKLKNYGKGMTLLKRSFDMDPDDFDNNLIGYINKAESKIKSSYLIGSFIGSFIWTYIIALLFLSNRIKIDALCGHESSEYLPQELFFIGLTYFSIVLLIHHLFNKNRLSKWFFNKYSNRVNPELFRMVLGALSCLPSLILLSIIIALTHQIGLIEWVALSLRTLYDLVISLF